MRTILKQWLRSRFFLAQSRLVRVKRIALITILLSLGCSLTAHAQSRGFTSTQTSATGGGTGSFDSMLKGTTTLKTPLKDDSAPIKPKEKVYAPPARIARSKTAKDDRPVVVTKDAWSLAKPIVKTTLPPKATAESNKVKPILSRVERAGSIASRTEFSPLPRSIQ